MTDSQHHLPVQHGSQQQQRARCSPAAILFWRAIHTRKSLGVVRGGTGDGEESLKKKKLFIWNKRNVKWSIKYSMNAATFFECFYEVWRPVEEITSRQVLPAMVGSEPAACPLLTQVCTDSSSLTSTPHRMEGRAVFWGVTERKTMCCWNLFKSNI